MDTGIYQRLYRCRPTTIPWWQSSSSTEKTGPRLLRKCGAPWARSILDGIDTNIDYQYEILSDPDYQAGNFDIEFLNTHRIGGISNGL